MGLKNVSGLNSPGGGMLAKLFNQHPELQDGEDKAKYTYDPNSQQYAAMKKGGMTASNRADGCATKGKTKGRFV